MNGLEYLQQLAFAHVVSRVLAAAVFLNVFDVITPAGNTAEEIAASTHCSLRGIRILLDTLASLQLMGKAHGKYFLTNVSKSYLRKDSLQYMGRIWEREDSMSPWDHLIDSIKSGKPWKEQISPNEDDNSFASLDHSLHVVNTAAAERAAQYLTQGCAALTVLDIACGSGVWGIALAMKNPESRIVAQDFPEILKLTRHYVESQQLEHQFTYLPGNLRKIDFGENRYELIILGNILHYEGESLSRILLKRVYAALKENGRVAIMDVITNEERTAPQAAVAFALFLLLGTLDGDVFTLRQYKDWLHEAGFGNTESIVIGAHSPMIVARKGSPS
jgi:ubiquinone/menaquinone biosynthesis C-methylase UbiE